MTAEVEKVNPLRFEEGKIKNRRRSCPPVTKRCSASQQMSKAIMSFLSPLCFDLQDQKKQNGDRLLGCHQGKTCNTFWKHRVTYIREISAHMRACLCMGARWISLLNQPPWVLIPLDDRVGHHPLLLEVKTLIRCPVYFSHPAWVISLSGPDTCQVWPDKKMMEV